MTQKLATADTVIAAQYTLTLTHPYNPKTPFSGFSATLTVDFGTFLCTSTIHLCVDMTERIYNTEVTFQLHATYSESRDETILQATPLTDAGESITGVGDITEAYTTASDHISELLDAVFHRAEDIYDLSEGDDGDALNILTVTPDGTATIHHDDPIVLQGDAL